jgi:hypothetical protein
MAPKNKGKKKGRDDDDGIVEKDIDIVKGIGTLAIKSDSDDSPRAAPKKVVAPKSQGTYACKLASERPAISELAYACSRREG